MYTAPSTRSIDSTRIDPFFRQLITQVVPEMMDLAGDELRWFETAGFLAPEATPSAVVPTVLDVVLARLSCLSSKSWCATTLQCALLVRLAELTAWERGIPPTSAAVTP